MTDQDLAERIKAGDERAFEETFREHYVALTYFAVRYTGDRASAEELVQGLFTDLWVERSRWEIHASIRSYLFAAVRNRALNQRRRARIERDWDEGAGHADTDALQWEPARADETVEREEAAAGLRRAIASLPERCRLVMQLRWRDQLSYGEIAEVLGISVKGVENQLARGLKALREKLL
jgi:RNA polymerase sigma-70 factor (ECF subfamily)